MGRINEAKRALEIRATLSKSSTKKYEALLKRAGVDSRVRDISLYHGAHTGRESGAGLQLQNLPRGFIKDTDQAIEDINSKSRAWVRAIYGDVMGLFSSTIRGMIKATPGFTIYSADYNAIEARVLAWLADEKPLLKIFFEGGDPYRRMASSIYKKHFEDVDDLERQVGKVAVLGLGFGMGANKFFDTCDKFRLQGVDLELAEQTVKAYRQLHPNIVKFWGVMERLAIKATNRRGHAFKFRNLTWEADTRSLWCQLPSGRRLYYQRPSVRVEPTPWGAPSEKLYYYSVDSLSKKWTEGAAYGGLLTENVVQAVARDVMVDAMKRVDLAGYEVLFAVHDEIVSESKNGDLKQYERLLSESAPWAKGLPVTAKGWAGERYKKG